MFTDADKIQLTQLGEQMLPLEHCGSILGYTREEFLELYELDKDAKLHYERGLTKAAAQIINTIKLDAKSKWQAMEYLATNIINVKKVPSNIKKETPKQKKNENNDDHWLDKI